MAEAIPRSAYPVLGMYGGGPPPRRTLDGPYIASRPAYEMFANLKPGQSIGDAIDADMQAQAKAEGRPNPVTERPENAKYWFHDGEKELLPNWSNPTLAPVPAPILPLASGPLAPAAISPAPLPATPAPVTPAIPDVAAPAPAERAASAAAAPPNVAPRARIAAARTSRVPVSHLTRRLANVGYQQAAGNTPRAGVPTARLSTTRSPI